MHSTHDDRERTVISELERFFPNFSGTASIWDKVSDGHDPPDFISRGPMGPIGLELVEWLDGNQMREAKARESLRNRLRKIIGSGGPNIDRETFTSPSSRPNKTQA